MKIRNVLVAGAAFALTVGGASVYAGSPGTNEFVPSTAVELVEEIDYGPTMPMVRWPHGLYTTLTACKEARTDFIGAKGGQINTGAPLAMWTCGGNGYFNGQVTNIVPAQNEPTTYYDAALNESITAMNADGSIPQ